MKLEVQPDVSTMTIGAPEEVTRMKTDPEDLVAVREARFRRRKARIEADQRLDRRIKALYLDRTIWYDDTSAAEMGVGKHRIAVLRGGRTATRRKAPHPSAFPEEDTLTPSAGVEAGRVREWAVKRGTHMLDPETGKLTKTGSRHGRARHARLVMSKPNATTDDVREALTLIKELDIDVPDHLIAAGRLRVAHPEASLRELGEMLNPPVTKSTFASLLRQLVGRPARAQR